MNDKTNTFTHVLQHIHNNEKHRDDLKLTFVKLITCSG